jgi:beta-galactosidase/beta-glucuronidase
MKRAGVVLLVGAAASCSGSTSTIRPLPAERAAPAEAARQNLALHRAAYQSSSANFDETAHLVTDGVVTDDTAKYPEGHETAQTADSLMSQWRSDAGSPQWIYVDLGAPATFDRVILRWGALHPTAYRLEASDDAARWTTAQETSASDGGVDDISLRPTTGRYVRMYTDAAAPWAGYTLRELEVYGTGGAKVAPKPLPSPEPDGTQYLSGGKWRLERALRVTEPGESISSLGFDDDAWIVATVPGTVLTSYLDVGAIPDPNYGDQQRQISDAFFTADFWYRDTFSIPKSSCGKRIWLNFDGINWKADVFFNGGRVGAISGAFTRGRFDVTARAKCDGENALAVLVHKNEHPGAVKTKTRASAGRNGGVLGADNPTIHASIGWDWMPTIRGRNTGIQGKVSLSTTGDVSISDPFVTTRLPLPRTAPAELAVNVGLENHSDHPVSGELGFTIMPGNIAFSEPVTLKASEKRTVLFDKARVPSLSLDAPALWWPNGYGAQNLYSLEVTFKVGNAISDVESSRFGIRQITSDTNDGVLTLYVNGKRLFVRGGNWGMSESMLRLDDEGYDVRVRLHQDQNFTMIRNWIGMTSSEAFYDACDKYGILVWDDFWLANPFDGPDPADPALFMANARDKIRRVRKHASVALYCGRNEGAPPESLATALSEAVRTLDGTRPYIPDSAAGSVEGHGPYSVRDPAWYFEHSGSKIHSEVGMPCVPSAESMRAMLPAEHQWPIDEMWGVHDFCDSAQDASTYTNYITESYGAATSLDDYCSKAQMVNLENYKALFEGYAANRGNGVLLWMSQSAWPSTVWQTFDYYLEPTAAYFGAKRASEPVHVLWDPRTDAVKVTNNSGSDLRGLEAEARVYDLDGRQRYSKRAALDSPADSVTKCFTIAFPRGLSSTHFVKLLLRQGTRAVSDNFYWRGERYRSYEALAGMPRAAVTGSARRTVDGTTHPVIATVTNPTANVALMVRLLLTRATSGARVLPTYYADNYFSLLPGESKDVSLKFDDKYLGGEQPKLLVQGFNVPATELPVE